jgi:uncharacterized protein DUF927
MDRREVLRRIIPWDIGGYCSIHWQWPGAKGFSGHCCASLDEAIAFINTLPKGVNCYICMGRHDGERKRAHIRALQSLYTDVDVVDNGSGEIVHPVIPHLVCVFCQRIGIPNPTFMIASGSGGVHPYWCNIGPLTVDQWQPYADALKAAILKFDWQRVCDFITNGAKLKPVKIKVDAFVTADSTRVLRLLGSENQKHNPPRPVLLVRSSSTCVDYDFTKDFTKLKEKVVREPEGFVLGEGIDTNKVGPVPFAPIREGCAWLRVAHETGGRDYNEPQWHLTTLSAVFMEGGHELAHAFGSQHPGYSYESTEEKWERKCKEHDEKGVGWPSCKSIEAAGSKECKACPHFAKGKSPHHLALDVIHEREDEQLLKELDAERPKELSLPKDYVVNKKTGYICDVAQKYNKKGQPIGPKYLLELFLCEVHDPIASIINGLQGVSYEIKSGKNPPVRVFTPMGGFEPKKLAENGINNRSENGKKTMKFGESWIETLHRLKASRDLSELGWRYEDGKICGFVYGGTFTRTDGTTTSSGLNTEDHVLKWYQPSGGKEPWYRAAKLLTDRKRVELDVILAVGFAAPLMIFAGTIYGGMLSIWGEAGTSKSTAQQLACAVWAHPKFGRETLNSTSKSVLNKLGMLKNLPAYWDDIQDEVRQEHLFQAMFINAQGLEGGRLTTNIEQRERKQWHTFMVACSNASFVEYVIKKQPSTTAGIRRVLEFEINRIPNEPGLIDNVDAINIYGELEYNYGRVGYEYARLLATEHEQIRTMVIETVKRFRSKVGGKAEETYWWGMAGVLVAGSHMALRMGVDIDPVRIEDFLVDVFVKNRQLRDREATEGGSQDNTWNALVGFLINFIGKGHSIRRSISLRHGGQPISEVPKPPREGCPLYIDIIEGENKLRISKKAFRKYLNDQQIQPRQVITGLERHYGAKVDNFKATLGSGTQWAVAQEDVIEIPITGPLMELMRQAEDDEPTFGGSPA